MRACTECGHSPVTGRFCPACGRPGGAAGATQPVLAAGTAPPPARFPLYADEPTDGVPGVAGTGDPTAPEMTAERPALADVAERSDSPPAEQAPVRPLLPPPGSHAGPRRGTGPLPWIIGLAFVLLLALVGGVLLMTGGADEPAANTPAEPIEAADPPAPEQSDEEPEGAGPKGAGSPLVPADIAVPGSASASRDNDGNPVTYGPENLFDEAASTGWRVGGDASGDQLTFSFDGPVTITEVGLINGYAKQDPPNDWYGVNRRILEVEWIFDDGTVVRQSLDEVRDLQAIEIDAVETQEVQLRLVRVSGPGGRDYTAISEVSLVGSTG